jgi:arabinogalactan endo-1,4-beta-galactosidase
MIMKRLLLSFGLLATVFSCTCCGGKNNPDDPQKKEDEKEKTEEVAFAKGADISWCTEMESKGYKFYDNSGTETECTALMKALGFNSIRLRVWVNPTNGWCGKDDVLVKAKRAQALGMNIMIDFHYSDSWADPARQNVPAAWKDYSTAEMATAVGSHTREVLSALKSAGIDVSWVAVGNEVEGGMLWPTGKVSGSSVGSFISYLNAGYAASKEVYPEASVVLHISNGWNSDATKWFFDLMKTNGGKYDIIGLSLYPSYWDESSKSYPDWTAKTKQFVMNINTLYQTFKHPVMLCEVGMPASQPEKAKAMLQYIFDNTKTFSWFKGIFYWEPESENSRNGYAYGAFENGRATAALDPFSSN